MTATQILPHYALNNNLAIASTMFPHKEVHKYTWTSPDGQHQNQIDHVVVRSPFKRSVQDTKTYRGADVGSDHKLIITKVKLTLSSTRKKQEGTLRYEESKLTVPEIRQQFQIELRNTSSRHQIRTTWTQMITRTASHLTQLKG